MVDVDHDDLRFQDIGSLAQVASGLQPILRTSIESAVHLQVSFHLGS